MRKQYPLDVENYNFNVRESVQIRFNDLDGYGHANNSSMQAFFDLGRAAYMNRVCGPSFYKEPQTLLVVSYTTDFMRQVFLEDDIEVRAAVYRIGTRSLNLLMALVDRRTGEVCAVSDSVMSGYDKRTCRSMPIPQKWREACEAIEGRSL